MTLIEIMIAGILAAVVLTGTLRLLLNVTKSYQYETGKLMVNNDVRRFTSQMMDDATYANYFLIFSQTSDLNRSGATPVGSANPTSTTYQGYDIPIAFTEPTSPVSDTGPGTLNVTSGLTGDVVVFVYNIDGDNTKIKQFVIYYRRMPTTAGGTDGTNSNTLSDRITGMYRMVVPIEATAQGYDILKLLPVLSSTNDQYAKRLFPFVDGLATNGGKSNNRIQKMFYNYNNTSVIIRGKIYENYTGQRLVKSTYNFTVTPRG